MNPDTDYYAVLGVLPSADEVVIRAAYKALAQRYHPDKRNTDAPNSDQRMAELNEAYSVLSIRMNHKHSRSFRAANYTGCGVK